MEPVTIAVGSNLGNREKMLRKTGIFLEKLTETTADKSDVWESEPVGPAKFPFLNAAAKIFTTLSPRLLLDRLKKFEAEMGRKKRAKRWSPRILDLDIITYGNLVIHSENLIIPHPEYTRRLFVLYPMRQIYPSWIDPETNRSIHDIIEQAPDMQLQKTKIKW